VKVRILLPQSLHDVVQKALITEEGMNGGGQGRTPSRQSGKTSLGEQQHLAPSTHTTGPRVTPRGPVFETQR